MNIKKINFYKGGFTLLELLIVIAIIGILAAIIMANLGVSRSRAYDSKIKQQLTSFRNAAEIYYNNNNNTYAPAVTNSCVTGGTIFTDTNIANGRPGATIAQPNPIPSSVTLYCSSTATAYALKATMYSGTEYYCVDSVGSGKVMNGTPVASTSC